MKIPSSRFRISLLAVIGLTAITPSQVAGHRADIDARAPAASLKASAGVSINAQPLRLAPVRVRYVTQQRGSITGQVVFPSGQQVDNRIRVTLSGYRISDLTTYTDNKGRFIFQGVTDGTYTVEVQADTRLYYPVTQDVRVINAAAPPLVITLRLKEGAAGPKPSVVSAAEVDEKVPEAARKEFEKGVELSEKGKFKDAAERFKKAIDLYPSYLTALNNLGAQYLKLGKWAEAEEQFQKAVDLDSKSFSPRLNLAIVLIEQKKYVPAIENLNHALSIDSSSPTVHLYAGIASIGIENIDQAERELKTAISIGGPQQSLAHFFLGLTYIKKGEREPAIAELKAYLDKQPEGDKAARARQLIEKLKQSK